MIGGSATHRGAPFAGRHREIGILTHLLEDGLAGTFALIRVAAPTGTGRRRLIHEALRHGPDAEWIHLAPGGVEADLSRWMRTELIDLLDTYPDAAYPSWALHVVAHWTPRLGSRARIPRLSREPFPEGNGPELVGAAIGALLLSLTDRTLVVVEAGLWPAPGSPRRRALEALARSLQPAGAVLLAADEATVEVDPPGVRTLVLPPWRAEEIGALTARWLPGASSEAFAAWLYTVSAGHPFFVHETIRWLEELGHLHLDDEECRVDLLTPIDRLPLPLFLSTVLEARYHRLAPDAARLLHLLSQRDGTRHVDALRREAGLEDEMFEEALAGLRRRAFLLTRTHRRPLALASPLWRAVAEEGALRFSRQAHRPVTADPRPPRAPVSPLARARHGVSAPREAGDEEALGARLAAVHHATLGRSGPAWDGIRGRLAIRAALRARERNRPEAARRWTGRGLRRTAPEHHPVLRRRLWEIRTELLEAAGKFEAAEAGRLQARDEARATGHLVSAAVLDTVLAESARRRGKTKAALENARASEATLRKMGLEAAGRAGATVLAALLDRRHLALARAELARRDEGAPGWSEANARLLALERHPPVPAAECPAEERAGGWGWGLEDHRLLDAALEALARTASSRRGTPVPDLVSRLRDTRDQLRAAGLTTAAADLSEAILYAEMDPTKGPEMDAALEDTVRDTLALDSPERVAFLAEALRTTPVGERPGFRKHFAPGLLRPVSSRRPEAGAPVRFQFTGWGRVEGPDRIWPRALWPGWWLHLWSEVLVHDLFGRDFSREALAALLDRHPDAPGGNLESIVHTANGLLTGAGPPAGGLHLEGRRVVVSWEGIAVDIREFLDAVESPSSPPERMTAAALRWIEGEYLAGFETPGTRAVRERMHEALGRVRDALRPHRETLGLPVRLGWAEGPGRVVPLDLA